MNNLTFDDKVFLIYLELLKTEPEFVWGIKEEKAKMYAEKAFLTASYAQEKWDEMITSLPNS